MVAKAARTQEIFLMVPSPFVVALGENGWGIATFREQLRNFFEWIFS
jgi:hypothetical protein